MQANLTSSHQTLPEVCKNFSRDPECRIWLDTDKDGSHQERILEEFDRIRALLQEPGYPSRLSIAHASRKYQGLSDGTSTSNRHRPWHDGEFPNTSTLTRALPFTFTYNGWVIIAACIWQNYEHKPGFVELISI